MTTSRTIPRDVSNWCEQVTRQRARNFYYGLKLAPSPKREALFALYAWMREADDLVDDGAPRDSPVSLSQRIADFQKQTHAALSGTSQSSEPLWVAFAHTAQTYALDRADFDAMMEGQMMDAQGTTYTTFADLRGYCERVASTVGRLCVQIWGSRDPRTRELATLRGVGIQLTNILRDFAEDFDMGRIYLPAEDFQSNGLTARDLREWSKPAQCSAFMNAQIARAMQYYDDSSELETLIEPDCQPVCWAMTQIYQRVLKKIAANPQRAITGRRVRLHPLRKGLIAMQAQRQAARMAR
ncbi:MAG: phytoene/squalene synthase family protein [Phycisphaerales bacterium]